MQHLKITLDTSEKVILQTKKWITDVVIGLNLCPFAAKEVKKNSVHYEVNFTSDAKNCLQTLIQQFQKLDQEPSISTTLIILPEGFQDFEEYLDLLEDAETVLQQYSYEGKYQIASFHPDYRFDEEEEDDAANFTNRSPYPMLHILREDDIDEALARYPNHEDIPDRNIKFTRDKGLAYMKMLRDACLS